MNEKPEALRLADAMWAGRLDYGIAGEIAAELRRLHAENERLREEVRNWKKSFVGHVYVKNEDYAELISKRDALKTENERLREALTYDWDQLKACRESLREHMVEIKRLREALKLALNSHGRMLMSDPPQDAWKFNRVDEVIVAALRREET